MNLHLLQSGVVTSTNSFIFSELYFKIIFSLKSSFARLYPFILPLSDIKPRTDILYMFLSVCYACRFSYHYIRIYPCLYLLGKYKAHSLYRCVGSCISLALNRCNSSCCISGSNTLLVISVSFSICSGKIRLEKTVCIASCTFTLIVSTFKSLVAP